MNITTDQIKELRDETGVSIMQCKKALEEAGGDLEKAKIILRKISKQSADKKSTRTLGAGLVVSYVHGNGSVGSLVELLCETDFVARNEEFVILAKDIAMHITALAPEYLKMDDIKEEDKVKAKELFEKDLGDKPKEMRDKILEGKLAAYFGEKVLLEQAFIKNPEVKIGSLIEQAIQKFGERTEIGRFVRFSIK
ncbi:MAG: elongation factor Ts [Patescibacteria group bacterium]